MQFKKQRVPSLAGALILLGLVVGIFSIVPSVESDEYLIEVASTKYQVFTGALFQFFLVPIYIGFALLLYPVLKPYNAALSIGFVGFRFVAATFQLLGIILLPVFVLLSESYLGSSPAEATFFDTTGDVVKLVRDLVNHLGVILATGLGNLLFYLILYREKLIPKWLSLWGSLGNLMIMVAGFLIVFQQIDVVSQAYGALSIPLVLQEITLALWLLTKGLPATEDLNT